jgi:uncharacterized protein (TIGR03083 family)
MSEPLPEIACENCVAACCKAPVRMSLTADEYKRHSKTMDLSIIAKPSNFAQRIVSENADQPTVTIPSGFGLYLLESGCANLTRDNRCSIYASRPKCCADYAVGSSACLKARRNAGLDADRPLIDEEEPPELDPTEQVVAKFFPTLVDAETSSPSTPPAEVPLDLLDRAELCRLVEREARWIAERLSQCDAGAWSRRTRCAEWDVQALAAHLVDCQRFTLSVLTAAIEGGTAKTPEDFRGGPAETVAAFRRAADEVGDALARLAPVPLDREVVIDDVAAVTLSHLIERLAMENAVHGLDLAHALGDTRHLTTDAAKLIANVLPDVLDAGVTPPPATAYLLRSLAFELPFTWRNNAWRRERAADPCSIEGEVEAVLLYALGRVPFNKSRLSTNRPNRAREFKRYLIGP